VTGTSWIGGGVRLDRVDERLERENRPGLRYRGCPADNHEPLDSSLNFIRLTPVDGGP